MVVIEKAVYIFAGFLESGKTSALQGMLFKTRRKGDGKAVVICTEEGEEEYRIDELKELNVDVLIEEDEECLSKEHLEEIDRIYVGR